MSVTPLDMPQRRPARPVTTTAQQHSVICGCRRCAPRARHHTKPILVTVFVITYKG